MHRQWKHADRQSHIGGPPSPCGFEPFDGRSSVSGFASFDGRSIASAIPLPVHGR